MEEKIHKEGNIYRLLASVLGQRAVFFAFRPEWLVMAEGGQ